MDCVGRLKLTHSSFLVWKEPAFKYILNVCRRGLVEMNVLIYNNFVLSKWTTEDFPHYTII